MAILTVFAMLSVVLGHSDITPDYKQLWYFRWIYSFHMPLFFFISGFLFSLTNPIERLQTMSYTSFLKKKTVRLLIPFLFFNTVIFLIKATLVRDPSMMQHPTTLALDSFIHYTLFAPIGFMWFLPALFIVFVLIFPFWKIIRCKLRRGGGIFTSCSGIRSVCHYRCNTCTPGFSANWIGNSLYAVFYLRDGILPI